jgi:hypothetical protein
MNEKIPATEPHGFEDLGWRIGYRVRRGLFHIFGPPTLNERNDPHKKLERERAARYANWSGKPEDTAQGAKRSTVQSVAPRV